MTVSNDSNDATNGNGGGDLVVAIPEEELGIREEEVSTDDRNLDDDDEEAKTYIKCFKCVGGFYHRAIDAWPRTSAIAFGVVMPLFLLIALSVLFGE